MNQAYITHIGLANPPHEITQDRSVDFMSRALGGGEALRRKLRVLYRSTAIDKRHSVLEDYIRDQQRDFYPENDQLEPFPVTSDRMEVYRREGIKLAKMAIASGIPQEVLPQVTHLITVSCTGMYAPGLDIDLVEQVPLATHVQRTCVNFMGCYAAFNALKIADTICRAEPAAKVLIVDVELCTLHFQKKDTPDHLIANALFADGAAAVLVQANPIKEGNNLALEGFFSDLVPAGRDEMAWHITETGFEMKLSAYVPEMLQQGIGKLVSRLLETYNLTLDQIDRFAIHPGGRRILEVIEKVLGITREDNAPAYEVLRQYGNMSSVTVLFVLEHLRRQLTVGDQGKRILSMAFGPGLTLESAVLRVS
ncbi:MAG: type III polyketide synthase [Bacteroidota bacterium]